MPFRVIAADHTGITVSDLERSLAFWRNVLGFELSHRAHQTGELAAEITGVPGAEILIAVVKVLGHKIELLEYRAPSDRKHLQPRPCDVGSVHVALTVDDLDAVLEKIATSGWKTAGKPQTLKSGPNAGKRVIYVRDPDGTTIEFMQPPPPKKIDESNGVIHPCITMKTATVRDLRMLRQRRQMDRARRTDCHHSETAKIYDLYLRCAEEAAQGGLGGTLRKPQTARTQIISKRDGRILVALTGLTCADRQHPVLHFWSRYTADTRKHSHILFGESRVVAGLHAVASRRVRNAACGMPLLADK